MEASLKAPSALMKNGKNESGQLGLKLDVQGNKGPRAMGGRDLLGRAKRSGGNLLPGERKDLWCALFFALSPWF
jgi:hypothetical protein